MITSIYSLQYPDEAVEVAMAGSDWIGLLTGDDSCPAAVSIAQAKRIFAAVGKKAKKSAILMYRSEGRVLAAAEYLRPDIIHLCDDKVFATEEFCKKARFLLPGVEIMQAVAVGDMSTRERAVSEALRYDGVADYIILDSYVQDKNESGATPNGVGAAGIEHDWRVSAEIVRAVKRSRVVLAGGLHPGNVVAAMNAVRPYGVDSMTKTSIVENGVYLRKNIEKTREFIRLAHGER